MVRHWYSRRGALVGLGVAAVAVAGGAGALVGALTDQQRAAVPSPPAPVVLLAAADAERALLGDLVATAGGTPQTRQLITAAQTDHRAHLQVLEQLIARAMSPVATGSTSSSTSPAPRGTPRTRDELRTAELRASALAARHASALTGTEATILASISACEASHAALLA